MSEIVIKQMPGFKKAYKKLHSNEKKVVNETIHEIIKNPKIGEEKKATLRGYTFINLISTQRNFY